MNKFLFKSPDSDFQKLLQQVNKNILYVTHMEDKILKLLQEMNTDSGLQTQVDKFYDDESHPDVNDDKEPD